MSIVNTLVETQFFIDHMRTALLACDASLEVVTMNPAAEALFDLSARQTHGQPISELCIGCHTLVELAQRGLDEERSISAYDLSVDISPTRTFKLDIHVTPIPESSENTALLLEIVQVDHHLGWAKTEAQADQNSVNQDILRGLAHEVKNPLGGLRGAAQLLDQELQDREQREYTRIIIHEADRLRNLVDRMMGSHRVVEVEPINIHQVLEHVRKLTLAEIQEGLDFERDYDPSLPDIQGNREQLTQVVINIVRNAVDALQQKGKITLRSRVGSGYYIDQKWHRRVLKIDIEDDGPGIDAELQAKVFYPMVTSRADGRGLGLSIAQDIVRNHGGTIELESQPGFTRFSMLLPWLGESHHE